MECREVRQLAEAFVSEQLLVETTRAVVAHLERCPACQAEIDELRQVRTAMRSAFNTAPDLMVRPEFVAGLTTRLQSGVVGPRVAWAPRRAWLALAASLLLLVGVGWGWRTSVTSSLAALLQAAVGDHRFCALTFKLDEPPIRLEEAARRYGGVHRLLATVEPSTTALAGGPLRIIERHSCVFNGRRFAHLVLLYKDQPVSLLVADDVRSGGWFRGTGARPSELPVTDGFHVASFRGAQHVVFVVSSLAAEDVQDVARAMAEPVSRVLAAPGT